jgi:curved DNA-binding protein CbpA
MTNPFSVLGVPNSADDETIKKAYLQKVREHPPEREPQRFQAIRSAFESIKTQRDRLRYQLFDPGTTDLEALLATALRPGRHSRPAESLLIRALLDSLAHHP